jgi:large subunit ribosomal protein L17
MFRNQLTALFTHDRIITTLAKAKELRPLAERVVTIARTDSLAARRRVATMVQDKEVARRLFDEIAPRFADRPGGYTRIMRLGRRHGDNAELAIIEFVDYELSEHQDRGDGESKGSFLDRAKGMFGAGAGAGAEGGDDKVAADAADGEVEEAPVDEAAAETEVEPVEAEALTEDAVVETEPEPEADVAPEEETGTTDEPEVAAAPSADAPAAEEETEEATDDEEADEDKKDG